MTCCNCNWKTLNSDFQNMDISLKGDSVTFKNISEKLKNNNPNHYYKELIEDLISKNSAGRQLIRRWISKTLLLKEIKKDMCSPFLQY